jgi:hypothetical protein
MYFIRTYFSDYPSPFGIFPAVHLNCEVELRNATFVIRMAHFDSSMPSTPTDGRTTSAKVIICIEELHCIEACDSRRRRRKLSTFAKLVFGRKIRLPFWPAPLNRGEVELKCMKSHRELNFDPLCVCDCSGMSYYTR